MAIKTLQCPSCGGAVAPESSRCQYCGVGLIATACPNCFGTAFVGSRFCPHCGSALGATAEDGTSVLQCPRCDRFMRQRTVEGTVLTQCHNCGGLWVDADAFRRICADRDRQAVALDQIPLPKPPPLEQNMRYIRCPRCQSVMNRVNFAHRSGVIIDICTPHGIWLDRDELRRIIDFILAGGMDRARRREREELDAARRAIEAAQSMHRNAGELSGLASNHDIHLAAACRFAGEALRSLIR